MKYIRFEKESPKSAVRSSCGRSERSWEWPRLNEAPQGALDDPKEANTGPKETGWDHHLSNDSSPLVISFPHPSLALSH